MGLESLLKIKAIKNQVEYNRQVILTKQSADGIITYSKTWHPHEGILILAR